ncbi:MAG: methyltransferase family protein [Pyrinomonadaceae bacterium]
MMLALQIYLFLGLVLHKVVWEVLGRSSSEKPKENRSAGLLLIKAVKIFILVGILVQIWVPENYIFPIATDSTGVRIAGVIIYTIGLATALAARFQLGENWANIETGQVLTKQEVVANGIYRYVRHPIYVGDLLLLFGLELALNSWLLLGVLILAPVVMKKAIGEEQMLAAELPGYDAYRDRSKRFIPFVY